MFYLRKSQFLEKKSSFPIEKFPSLASQEYDNVKNTLLSYFRSIICQVVAYSRLKTIFFLNKNFKLLPLKVVAVAYEGW